MKNAESAGSPLLAFTPTSVMRKNAAERKDSDPRPGVPELKVRVIVCKYLRKVILF